MGNRHPGQLRNEPIQVNRLHWLAKLITPKILMKDI